MNQITFHPTHRIDLRGINLFCRRRGIKNVFLRMIILINRVRGDVVFKLISKMLMVTIILIIMERRFYRETLKIKVMSHLIPQSNLKVSPTSQKSMDFSSQNRKIR